MTKNITKGQLTPCQGWRCQERVREGPRVKDWDNGRHDHWDNNLSISWRDACNRTVSVSNILMTNIPLLTWRVSGQTLHRRYQCTSGTPGTGSASWPQCSRSPRSRSPRPGPASWSRPWRAPACRASSCWPPRRTWSGSDLGYDLPDWPLEIFHGTLINCQSSPDHRGPFTPQNDFLIRKIFLLLRLSAVPALTEVTRYSSLLCLKRKIRCKQSLDKNVNQEMHFKSPRPLKSKSKITSIPRSELAGCNKVMSISWWDLNQLSTCPAAPQTHNNYNVRLQAPVTGWQD